MQLGIPQGGGSSFSEWGNVLVLDDDLLTVQLSRQQLPENSQLRMGGVLELKVSRDGTFFGCQALLVEEYEGKELTLRLIGNMSVDDLREYYRIDVYLPFKYSLPDSQNPSVVRRDWETMREVRANRQEQRARFIPFPNAMTAGDQSWENLPPVVANISGGGLKVNIPEQLAEGTLVDIELFLPVSPPQVIDIVGRVIFSTPLVDSADSDQLFNTALSFHFITERDRDTIVSFIAAEQLARLRSISGRVDAPASHIIKPSPLRHKILRWSAMTAITLVILYLFARSLLSYYQCHEKNEIESIFEQGVKEYLQRNK